LSTEEARLQMFQSIPLFRSLGKEELMEIAASSKETNFESGTSIVKEGDAGLGFYLIADGQAVVKRKGRVLSKLGRGSFFGEMSLLDDQPRSADVVATEPTRCLILLRWNFWGAVSKNPKIARGLLQEMARRLRATNEALSE
jgi:CRP/FNR family transcriptional regulator, cyclic AMP receptor protein